MEVRNEACELLGYLPVYEGDAHAGRTQHVAFELRREAGDKVFRKITLEIAPFMNERSRWYALKSGEHPIETLRQISGWRDA